MDETISSMKRRFDPNREMLVIEARGPMPDGLVALCRLWGVVEIDD